MSTSSTSARLSVTRRSGATRVVRQAFEWHFGQIDPAARQALLALDWSALPDCPHATRVKAAENRDVWRIDLPTGAIYAKCYRRLRLGKRLLEAMRGPAARREWTALRQAVAIGIRAPVPLAYATAIRPARHDAYVAMLVTAALPADALALEDAWLNAAAEPDVVVARRRQARLAETVAVLLAKAHAGGLYHHDLHVGNILLFNGNQPLLAAMIDLHNAKIRSRASLDGIRGNLVQLNQWFSRHASASQRLRLLRAYCRQLAALLPADHPDRATLIDPKALARKVLARAGRYARHIHRGRDRRLRRSGKYFASLALPEGWTAQVAMDVKHGRPYAHALTALPNKTAWRDLLGQLRRLVDAGAHRVLKRSSRRVVLLADLPFGPQPWMVVVKHERSRSPLAGLLGRLRGDPLAREFAAGWRLLHRDIPVALPLAVATRRRGLAAESVLLAEYIPDSHDLDTFSRLHLAEMEPARAFAAKRIITVQLARTLRRLYACRLVHRDLKAANVRLQIPGGDLRKCGIVLVDVDGVFTPRLRPARALLRSLARLDASFATIAVVTRTDRLRLLQAVLRGMGPWGPDWKDAWRWIGPRSRHDQALIARTLPWLQPALRAVPAQ